MSYNYLVDRKTQLLISFCVTGRAHYFAKKGISLSIFTNMSQSGNIHSLH